jgi:integrase
VTSCSAGSTPPRAARSTPASSRSGRRPPGPCPPAGPPGRPARQAGGHARAPADLTVYELLAAFLRHAEQYYRKDGRPTGELREHKIVLGVLGEAYGHTPARDFGPLALKAVRHGMVRAELARGVINQRVGRIKRVFKWAVSEELVPAPVFQALSAVEGLRRGRSDARETGPVLPVPDDLVEKTIPFLNRQLAAMVRLQRLTGMRPGEVCSMRPRDLDVSGPVWLYSPAAHKTEHHGRRRVVPVGPRCQELLRPYLARDPESYLFSPREAWNWACRAGVDGDRRGGGPPVSGRAPDDGGQAFFSPPPSPPLMPAAPCGRTCATCSVFCSGAGQKRNERLTDLCGAGASGAGLGPVVRAVAPARAGKGRTGRCTGPRPHLAFRDHNLKRRLP